MDPFSLKLELTQPGQAIPGSFWGDSEAGLINNVLYVRADTPLHSALHESCHYICMPAERRKVLHTNAGGDYDEENAVCYLQIILSDLLPDYGKLQICQEMDEWGYSFRLGSARAWFEDDAQDALNNLMAWSVLNTQAKPLWQCRQ